MLRANIFAAPVPFSAKRRDAFVAYFESGVLASINLALPLVHRSPIGAKARLINITWSKGAALWRN